ncbi:MAG: hypothetical protein IKT57_08200 [Clostridia bacterium]|nr:hypothetical protein [Clostridia bacterium]
MNPKENGSSIGSRCYPSRSSRWLRALGFVLMALGAVLILFCVPYWAWWALLGAVLIAVGFLLTRWGQ